MVDVEHTDARTKIPKERKELVTRVVTRGIFQAVVNHVIALQSDILLFTNAHNGDQAATARALASSQAMTGVAGMLLNQIGGKLSDSLGRRPLFIAGPFVNLCCALAVVTHSRNVAVLQVARLLKSIFTTLSGTVMAQAALGDTLVMEESAEAGAQIQAAVGVAVIGGPMLETLCLKLGNHDPTSPYKAMALLNCSALLYYQFCLPETLTRVKPLDPRKFLEFLASLNPLAFSRVLFGRNVLLKKLLVVQTLQYCNDGKVTSDLFQQWWRNNLKWDADTARNFVMFWGFTVAIGGAAVQPKLRKALSPYAFSTVGNLSVLLGLCIHGLAERGPCMWAGVPFLVPGVNGGSAAAVSNLASEIATEVEGYGHGEWAGMSSNARAFAHAAAIWLIGRWYALCMERKIYPGSTWYFIGALCALFPQLLLMTMSKKDFEAPTPIKAP